MLWNVDTGIVWGGKQDVENVSRCMQNAIIMCKNVQKRINTTADQTFTNRCMGHDLSHIAKLNIIILDNFGHGYVMSWPI